jgi:hypothetical protein
VIVKQQKISNFTRQVRVKTIKKNVWANKRKTTRRLSVFLDETLLPHHNCSTKSIKHRKKMREGGEGAECQLVEVVKVKIDTIIPTRDIAEATAGAIKRRFSTLHRFHCSVGDDSRHTL